jgi:diacylglycerol kinase (ATP)
MMAADIPMTVIWHPSSSSQRRAEAMLPLLMAHRPMTLIQAEDVDHAWAAVEKLGDSAGVIVAAGGDGSVHQLAGRIVENEKSFSRPVTLGVLPLGTGNDLARSLQIPLEPGAAVETLFSARPRLIDVIRYQTDRESGIYVNMMTGGNTGRYLTVLTDEMKQKWGAFCYMRGIVDVIQNLQAFQITLTCDDGPPEQFSALNVFFANGRTSGGGMVVSPDACLDDGLIDILIVRDGEPRVIANLTASYFLSDYQSHELIVFRRARRVRVECRLPLLLTADGDSIGATPLELEVVPQALQILAAD